MSKTPFRTAYGPRNRVQTVIEGKSLTHQSFKAECDINRIMQKWQKTGVLEHRNTFMGQYGDFTNVPADYHSAMSAVIEAQDMFLTLPSSVRKRFANDPGNFLQFVSDPDNKEEMVKLGLAEKRLSQRAKAVAPSPDPKPEPKPAPKAAPSASE